MPNENPYQAPYLTKSRDELARTLRDRGGTGWAKMKKDELIHTLANLDAIVPKLVDEAEQVPTQTFAGVMTQLPRLSMLEQLILKGDLKLTVQQLHVDPKEQDDHLEIVKGVFYTEFCFPTTHDTDEVRVISSGSGHTMDDAIDDSFRDLGLMAKRGWEAS